MILSSPGYCEHNNNILTTTCHITSPDLITVPLQLHVQSPLHFALKKNHIKKGREKFCFVINIFYVFFFLPLDLQ